MARQWSRCCSRRTAREALPTRLGREAREVTERAVQRGQALQLLALNSSGCAGTVGIDDRFCWPDTTTSFSWVVASLRFTSRRRFWPSVSMMSSRTRPVADERNTHGVGATHAHILDVEAAVRVCSHAVLRAGGRVHGHHRGAGQAGARFIGDNAVHGGRRNALRPARLG